MKNSIVQLTYKMPGAILSQGNYEYKERTTGGSMLPESQRLFIHKPAKFSDCYKSVTLGEHFTNWAISDDARPSRGVSNRAYTFWRKFSPEERLRFHIARYCIDLGAYNYNYQIIEE
jgi:hypothetical protein